MNKLLERVLGAGSIGNAAILADSPFFTAKDTVTTDIPIINIAFSGALDGGLVPGLTMFAGESKTFKTLLALYCMKAYLDKYPDGIAVLYDSEFGITPEYLKSYGIDTERVLHIPIEHVEMLKFDIVKRLESIERGDRVFFMIDSLGALASKKEVEDALDEKSVADLSRAKAMRGLLRIITPHFTMKDLPCVVINHIYMTMEMYSKVVIPGGTAMTYLPNQIFVISKAQEKDKDGDLAGYKFTINIHKSRFVREKSRFPFTVLYEKGIMKWSGLLDIAMAGGYIVKPKIGWYQAVDPETGEFRGDKMLREKDIVENDDFWNDMIKNTDFPEYLKRTYTVGSTALIQQLEDEELEEDALNDVNE
jgi:RecA/RadA recombinase